MNLIRCLIVVPPSPRNFEYQELLKRGESEQNGVPLNALRQHRVRRQLKCMVEPEVLSEKLVELGAVSKSEEQCIAALTDLYVRADFIVGLFADKPGEQNRLFEALEKTDQQHVVNFIKGGERYARALNVRPISLFSCVSSQ